jgi:hypothetical protein
MPLIGDLTVDESSDALMNNTDVAEVGVSLDHNSPTRGICLEPTGSRGVEADEGVGGGGEPQADAASGATAAEDMDCAHIVTEAEAAEARADEVRETLAAFRAPTCGICLEPAGSMGILPDGCIDAETVASSGGLWWRMRIRLNVRTLPCGHVHCKPCWSRWEKSDQEVTRRRGETLGAARCPLCNASHAARVPQAEALAHLLTQAGQYVSVAMRPAAPSPTSPAATGQAGMRPLASARQECEMRERARRRHRQEELWRDAEELREYHEVKHEHGALAACYEYCRLRSQRFVAVPCRQQIDILQASLRQQARNFQHGVDAACEAAVAQLTGDR